MAGAERCVGVSRQIRTAVSGGYMHFVGGAWFKAPRDTGRIEFERVVTVDQHELTGALYDDLDERTWVAGRACREDVA